jgi:hypothetical protein
LNTTVFLLATTVLSAQLKKEATAVDKADPNAVAIAKGVEHLKGNVQRNAAAARALLIAGAKGYDIGHSLDEMLALLKQPSSWDQNVVARIQFASALTAAERYGKAASTDLEAAAKLLTADQQPDGSWAGGILATWSARTSLIASGMQPDNFTIVQADRWIRGLVPETVLEASSTILALELASDVMAENLRRTCLSLLRDGHTDAGGWKPSADAPPQVFDTALAVLALSALDVEPRLARSAYRPEELKEAIAGGKKFLVSKQQPDGSWPEETRPASQESFAQEISTTAAAVLALLTP